MKKYLKPEIEVIDFAAEEIATGTGVTGDPTSFDGEGGGESSDL